MCDLLVFALISSMLQCPITCYYIVNAQTEWNFTYHTIGSKARQCQPRRNSFSSYMGMLTTAQVWAQLSHQNLYVPEKTYCVQRHCSASSCHTWSTWNPMKRSYAALYAQAKVYLLVSTHGYFTFPLKVSLYDPDDITPVIPIPRPSSYWLAARVTLVSALPMSDACAARQRW